MFPLVLEPFGRCDSKHLDDLATGFVCLDPNFWDGLFLSLKWACGLKNVPFSMLQSDFSM